MSRPPVFDFPGKDKGKAKAAASSNRKTQMLPPDVPVIDLTDDGVVEGIDELWVDKYEPRSEGDLAVHQKKVESVRRWLEEALDGGPSGKLKKYRKLLVLAGPAGTAKTSALRVLSKEMNFDILEWKNSFDEAYREDDYFDRESLIQKFDAFLTRASTCHPLASGASTSTAANSSRKVILLEDMPNILHPQTQESFHAALSAFIQRDQSTPLVMIISDASTRADVRDEKIASGGGYGNKDVIDIRAAVPRDLLRGPYVDEISFNPIAATLMTKALQALLKTHFASSKTPKSHRQPSKDELSIIVESSNGDIRSAIMALQFSCISVSKGNKKTSGSRALLEAVTRREQSLHLFHLLGKIMYNKRKGDPPNPSASAKDKKREQELDARLKNPPPLPSWLSDHKRPTSRVDIDALYSDSPVDTSLFSLYIHQNYTQFCDSVDECSSLCDWLSWIDSSGGEQWFQANPHQFHLLTLGSLHALPSPVPRRSQKLYKPAFFDVLKRTREAEEAVSDVRLWMQEDCVSHSQMRAGGWTNMDVAIESGGVLKAYNSKGSERRPPPHAAFSHLKVASSSGADGGVLEDNEVEYDQSFALAIDGNEVRSHRKNQINLADEEARGSWLEADDIEDF
ncbi:Rad17-domain-containing protein [Schizopora paradoxa]|uniref:Rad17-domain-containing protein n=1 Tax=Schizopora paradoxa TaxID=27342 RepID=A0A0H2S4V3_9AGAM|nr:Rad17-domain-containing protein [Schizopora paradoxa]